VGSVFFAFRCAALQQKARIVRGVSRVVNGNFVFLGINCGGGA
jgi:hypothetical protein